METNSDSRPDGDLLSGVQRDDSGCARRKQSEVC